MVVAPTDVDKAILEANIAQMQEIAAKYRDDMEMLERARLQRQQAEKKIEKLRQALASQTG